MSINATATAQLRERVSMYAAAGDAAGLADYERMWLRSRLHTVTTAVRGALPQAPRAEVEQLLDEYEADTAAAVAVFDEAAGSAPAPGPVPWARRAADVLCVLTADPALQAVWSWNVQEPGRPYGRIRGDIKAQLSTGFLHESAEHGEAVMAMLAAVASTYGGTVTIDDPEPGEEQVYASVAFEVDGVSCMVWNCIRVPEGGTTLAAVDAAADATKATPVLGGGVTSQGEPVDDASVAYVRAVADALDADGLVSVGWSADTDEPPTGAIELARVVTSEAYGECTEVWLQWTAGRGWSLVWGHESSPGHFDHATPLDVGVRPSPGEMVDCVRAVVERPICQDAGAAQ